MIERSKIIPKKTETNRNNLASKIRKSAFYRPLSSPVDCILFLQKIIGNQAVNGLIRSSSIQSKLATGQQNDKYEQESINTFTNNLMKDYSKLTSREYKYNLPIDKKCPKTTTYKRSNFSFAAHPISNPHTSKARYKPCGVEQIWDRGGIFVRRERRVHIGGSCYPDATLERAAQGQGGSPLPEHINFLWGRRLGCDLSDFRIHTDPDAAQAVSQSGANAISYGRHIFFASGRYDPATSSGQALLGHELAHGYKPGM